MNLYFPVFFNRVSLIGGFTRDSDYNILSSSYLSLCFNCGIATAFQGWQKGEAVGSYWALKCLESQACE